MKKLYGTICMLFLFSCQKENVVTNQWNLPDAAFNELLLLCDTSTLKTYADFDARIDRIQELFSSNKDNRGAFPTVYKAITHAATVYIAHRDYQDSLFINDFAMDFSKRYLYILKHHLLNEPIEYHWKMYYQHCYDKYTITRLVLEGINAHLTIDLTRSLATVGANRSNQDDWILFGDKTVIAFPGFLDELQQEYHTDASGIFNVFFAGDILDSIFGEGATINFGFNLLRMESFNNSIQLQQTDKSIQTEKVMQKSFYDKETIFTMLDDMKLTP